MKRVLTELGEMKLSNEEVDDLISMVDVDGDSLLNYSEFVDLFTEKLVLWESLLVQSIYLLS